VVASREIASLIDSLILILLSTLRAGPVMFCNDVGVDGCRLVGVPTSSADAGVGVGNSGVEFSDGIGQRMGCPTAGHDQALVALDRVGEQSLDGVSSIHAGLPCRLDDCGLDLLGHQSLLCQCAE
jgi:hypothetical protein